MCTVAECPRDRVREDMVDGRDSDWQIGAGIGTGFGAGIGTGNANGRLATRLAR